LLQTSLLLGTAFLAYSFGVRYAVDADHIAAIGNVTRKLMEEGKRPSAAFLVLARGRLCRRFELRLGQEPISDLAQRCCERLGLIGEPAIVSGTIAQIAGGDHVGDVLIRGSPALRR
jgi:hypothetical protein